MKLKVKADTLQLIPQNKTKLKKIYIGAIMNNYTPAN